MPLPNIRHWYFFSDDIIAGCDNDGWLLTQFLREVRLTGEFYGNFEMLDFQRYRKVTKRSKIAALWRKNDSEKRFRFIVGKN